MKKYLVAVGMVTMFAISAMSYARDVTALVARYTDLDDKIRDACHHHCQGDRRQGRLDGVSIRRDGRDHHIVKMWASLKNQHHQDTGIGGGFALYEYTISVYSVGRLNQRNCKMTILDVSVSGDQYGLAGGAYDEIGKIYDVPNCHKFL